MYAVKHILIIVSMYLLFGLFYNIVREFNLNNGMMNPDRYMQAIVNSPKWPLYIKENLDYCGNPFKC